jgi:5-hydroxyisourate hydrolase-like protein (transthyretin family)
MRLFLLLIVFCWEMAAQTGSAGKPPSPNPNPNSAPTAGPPGSQPPAGASPSAPEDLCTIQGQVLNASTGEPLKKANLNLQRTDVTPDILSLPTTYSTTTDASGKFAMKDIEAGRYRLNVTRSGFVSTSYGARSPGRPGTTLSLLRGQNVKDVAFRLIPHSVVIGRIVDEDGEPIPNVRVQLMTYRYQQGRKQLSYTGGASTDDLGDYRIFGIAPGKYFVSATASNNQFFGVVQDRSAAPQPEEDYVPTYYPGTTDVATAAQLDVPAGGQLRGIEFTLTKAHTVHVTGHVGYSVAGRQRVMVYLLPRGPGMNGPMALRPTQSDAKGDFDIRGVGPGAYSLTAVINDGSKSYQARTSVDVGSTNIERLNVVIGPGIEVAGHVTTEGSDPLDLSNVRLMLQTREIGGIMFGGFSQGRLDEGGAFKLQDVAPGLFNLMVTGLPAGAYLKSVRSEQTDVLANGLNTEVPPAPLEVLISPNAAQVTGTVQNHDTGNPAPGATVVLVPQEKERKEQQSYFKTVSSDQNGGFTFKDVVPGEYKVFAWEDVESGAYMDPDYMKPIDSKGEALSLREKDQKALQLTMIPADLASGGGK